MKVISKQPNSKMCLTCGLENQLGLKAKFYNMENDTVCSILTFKKEHQSYPGRVHGGMACALLDELGGRTIWVKNPDILAVTATLNIKYRKPVPYDEELLAVGELLKRNGRIFVAKTVLMTKKKDILVETEGSYVILPTEKIINNNSLSEDEFNVYLEDDVKEIDI
ncbi:MAG: PaaI family thioesterase [Clostridia bacterium]|nr:PaaI family thioesterase [Clostridia bacterium]